MLRRSLVSLKPEFFRSLLGILYKLLIANLLPYTSITSSDLPRNGQ
jgi:hypothetical protein